MGCGSAGQLLRHALRWPSNALQAAGRVGAGVLAAAVVLLQGMVELFVASNYAVAVVFITPLALTIGTAGTDLAVTDVAGERLLDTLIGVLIAAALPWLIGRRGAPHLLRACVARVLRASAEVVDHLGGHPGHGRPGQWPEPTVTGPTARGCPRYAR